MSKFLAPTVIAALCFDSVDYFRDDEGLFEIQHPDHVAAALRHGLVPYDPATGAPIVTAPTRIESEFDATIAAKDAALAASEARNVELEERMARMEAMLAQGGAPGATTTADTSTDASGDTSSATGDTPETASDTSSAEPLDAIGIALAREPKFDAMNRDELAAWLKGVGVVVPGNVSEAKAREIVAQTVADYTTGKGE